MINKMYSINNNGLIATTVIRQIAVTHSSSQKLNSPLINGFITKSLHIPLELSEHCKSTLQFRF